MQPSPTVSSALGADKKSHLQRLLQKPIRFLFDQAIGLGHTGARILEFQHGLDQARLHYPSDRHRVFEDMPRIGAVAPAFAPNFLYEGEEITALLDWEMAHLGDPVEDLAWAYRSLWTPEMHVPIAEFVRHYTASGGIDVKPETLLFYRLFSEIKHAVISLTAAKSFADGRTRNLRLADRLTLALPCVKQFYEWLPA